jgi:hypothetical protein
MDADIKGIWGTVDNTLKAGVVVAKSVSSTIDSETKETTPFVLPFSSKYTNPSLWGQFHFQLA